MNHITFLCSFILFSIGEARFFKVPPKNLKSQSASDIAPTNPYTQADYKGFIYHESGEVRDNKEDAIEDASRIIRKAVAAGLRQKFGKFQATITAFADDDGFVREGIVYCGASEQAYDPYSQTTPDFTVNDTMPDEFSQNSARLIEYDGWGMVVDKDEQITYDTQQCGVNNCQEGSVISALSAEIRSTGYQIQHKDICLADANKVELGVRSAVLNSYSSKPAVLCNGTDGEVWFDKLRDCIGASISNCGAGCSVNANDAEFVDELCWVDASQQADCRNVLTGEDKADENIDAEPKINAIRRVMRYSLNQDIAAVQTTDYAYITGCTSGNCTSLRSLFAALNGNAQISAFRDLGIGESIAYWEGEIKSARTYLQGLADTFRNFRPITMQIYPFIEEEEIEGCPMGEVEKTPEDTGSEVAPLCYQKSLDINDLNKLSQDGQFISRSSCYCRNGKLDDSFIDIEKDDIYLSVLDSEVVKNECDAMAASVRTYCREIGSWGERGPWKATLQSLLPPSTIGRVKIYDINPSAHHLKRQTIIDNLVKTLPSKLDTSCGRIINADSDLSTNSSKLLRSNKGGNCLPFSKLYEVIYKLEYETGEQGMGMYTCDVDNTCATTGQTIEQSFCADKLETVQLSFRQLAYKWDTADPKEATRVVSSDPFEGNYNATFGGGFLTYTDETYQESQSVTVERTFCLVDWLSEFGLNPITDAGGHFHSNPFTAIKKYIDEAVFNTELAQSTKSKVISDNIDIWKAIRKELTTPEDANILDDIAVAAATHYLYIMTTDVDDVMEQETFREGARVIEQIANFTKEIQPLALQLPTLKTNLDNIVAQGLVNDSVVNSTVSAAFSAIFGSLNALPNAPSLGRRLTSRRLAVATYTDTGVACTTCFDPIVHTRNAAVQKSAARAQAQEDQNVINKKIVQQTNAITEALTEYNIYKTEANLIVLNNAQTELQRINSEKSILATVVTWINSGLTVGQNSSTTYLTNAQTDLSNVVTALATAISNKDTAFFNLKQANHALLFENMKNNPSQALITQHTNDVATYQTAYNTAVTAVNTATFDKYVADTKILYANNWVSDYWEYIPSSKWEPDLVDEIADHTAACNYCKATRATYLSNTNRTLSDFGLTRPALPNKYDDVKADVLEDIRRSISSINLDIMVVVQEIAKLSSNATTKENEAASIQRIVSEIQQLFDNVKSFESNAINEIQDLARYRRNRDAYEAFWDTTLYTSTTTADFRIQLTGDPWPDKTTIYDNCIAVLDFYFSPTTSETNQVFGYSTENATTMLTRVRALQAELATAFSNGQPTDSVLSGELLVQELALGGAQGYYEECDKLKYSYNKAAQYDVHVSACQAQYPFGTSTNCTAARDAITQRKADNAVTFDPPNAPTNTNSGGSSGQSWTGLAPTKASGMAGTSHTIIHRMYTIDQRIASSVAAQSTEYGTARSLFYTKAFNALRKYKVIGLPSGETDNTKLDADLTATRTNCRTEIQKIVDATKWMINNNVASTYLNSTHTISANNISMPDDTTDAVALHALVLATAQNFTFIEGDTNTAELAAYKQYVDTATSGVGETTACEATGLEGLILSSFDSTTEPVYRDTVYNTIKLNCKSGNAFSPGSKRCMVTPCNMGQYNSKDADSVITCVDCPAGQFATNFVMWYSYKDALGQDQSAHHKRDHSWKTDSSGNIITNLKCNSCPSGKFSSAGATACTAATEGYYAIYDQSASAKCHPGSYAANPETQETTLSSVTASSSALTNSTGCTFTEPGYYTDLSGDQRQIMCAAGTWQDDYGKSSCKDASIGHFVAGSGQDREMSCNTQTSSNPNGYGTISNRYTSTTGQTECAECPQGSIVSYDYTSCTMCQNFQNSAIAAGTSGCTNCDPMITQLSGDYYCRGDRGSGAVVHCNNDQATNFLVQYAQATWDQPCEQRLCSCPNGNPQVGSDCTQKDSEECTTCDAGSGLYNKTDSQTGAIIWADQTQTIAEKVCRTCSRPLFNNVPNTISACSVEHCPVGEGYPSTAPDMSAMTSADDHDGSFAGVICAACPPGSYSDSNAIGQCSKIPSGYGCAKNSKAYISTQVGLNADKTTNYTALRDLAAAKAIGAPYVPPFTSEGGCEAIAKCPLGTYRAISSTSVDVNDDSNFCKFIPQGYTCKVTGTCAVASGGTNAACANAITAQTCSEKSIAGGNCVFSAGNTVASDGCDAIELCSSGTYSTGPLKVHPAGRKNQESVQTPDLSNTCQAIPAGQECDLLNDGNQSVAYTGDENTRSFALTTTGCGSTRNCPRGLFRLVNSNDAKCSRIPLGEGCADYAAVDNNQNPLVRGKPSHYSTQNDEDSPGCKTVAACDYGYFRGIGVLDNNGATLSRYQTPATSSNAEGTVYDTWCEKCPLGHQCSDCGTTITATTLGAQISDGDDFTWIVNVTGLGVQGSEANQCRSARPCGSSKYKDSVLQGQTLCKTIEAGKECTDNTLTFGCPGQVGCNGPTFSSAGQMKCTDCCTQATQQGHVCGRTCTSTSSSCTCNACDAGTYESNNACTDCDSGKVSILGSTSCDSCGAGKFSKADQSACEDCPAGYFSSGTENSACTVCPIGKSQSAIAKSSCDDCSVGTFQDTTKQTSCKDCAVGKSQSNTGETSCDVCAVGKSQPAQGQSSCMDCGRGKFQDVTEQTSCKDCDAGTSQNVTGQTSCDDCVVGKHQPATGQALCTDCSAGTFQNETKQTSCYDCAAGKSQSAAVQTSCDDCAVGKSQPATGQATCVACVAGTFQTQTGQTSCDTLGDNKECNPNTNANTCTTEKLCATGYFRASGTSSNDCAQVTAGHKKSADGASETACKSGQYQPSVGQNNCVQTVIGHYSPSGQGAQTSQTACPPGQVSNAGASACTACDADEITKDETASTGTSDTCITCSDTVITANDGDATNDQTNGNRGSFPNNNQIECTGVDENKTKNAAGTGERDNQCECDNGVATTGSSCPTDGEVNCVTCNSLYGRYKIVDSSPDRFECVKCTDLSNSLSHTAANGASGTTSICARSTCAVGSGFEDPPFDMTVTQFLNMIDANSFRGSSLPLDCLACGTGTYSASNDLGQCIAYTTCGDQTDMTTRLSGASNQAAGTCDACDANTYAATDAANCAAHTTCGNDTNGNTRLTDAGATTAGTCAPCGDGEYAATGAANCATCASGEYSASGDLSCSTCVNTVANAETVTCASPGGGSVQAASCNTGYTLSGTSPNVVCTQSAGYNGGTQCTSQTNCAVDAAACVSSQINDLKCATADDGYYVDASGVVQQCAGVTNALTVTCTSSSNSVAASCNTGYYVNGQVCSQTAGYNGGTQCASQTNCATNVSPAACVSSQINDLKCATADDGYYVDAGEVKQCYSSLSNAVTVTCNGPNSGDIQTVSCNAGYVETGSAGSLACAACSNGQWSNVGATTCQMCQHSISNANSVTCASPNGGSPQLVSCMTGYYVNGQVCSQCSGNTVTNAVYSCTSTTSTTGTAVSCLTGYGEFKCLGSNGAADSNCASGTGISNCASLADTNGNTCIYAWALDTTAASTALQCGENTCQSGEYVSNHNCEACNGTDTGNELDEEKGDLAHRALHNGDSKCCPTSQVYATSRRRLSSSWMLTSGPGGGGGGGGSPPSGSCMARALCSTHTCSVSGETAHATTATDMCAKTSCSAVDDTACDCRV